MLFVLSLLLCFYLFKFYIAITKKNTDFKNLTTVLYVLYLGRYLKIRALIQGEPSNSGEAILCCAKGYSLQVKPYTATTVSHVDSSRGSMHVFL